MRTVRKKYPWPSKPRLTLDGDPMEDLVMKAATVIAVALAAVSSFPSPAQQDQQNDKTPALFRQAAMTPMQMLAMIQEPTNPAQSPSASPAQTEPSQQQAQPDQQPRVKTVQLQLITGELTDKLDSKSAKQGDSVVLKTREDAKTPDGTDIPKGSKLVGHVTNVQARGDGKENSQITLQFDRADLKSGQSVPIESVLESVSPSAGQSAMENNNNGMAAMPATPGATPAPMTGSNSGVANPANNNGANQNAMNDRPGADAGATPTTPAQQQQQMNGVPAPGTVVARNGNVAIRTTSIPGILIANNINGQPFSNASGMLLGARRDIRLENGTQIVVAVATAPQGAGSGMSR